MSLYDQDVLLWTEQQAALLRRVAAGEAVNEAPDWSNIIEEIESLGISQRTALSSQITRILDHLLKLKASPANDPRRGWEEGIIDAQREIELLLDHSPSLRREIPDCVAQALPCARRLVLRKMALYGEKPTVDLDTITLSAGEVLGKSSERRRASLKRRSRRSVEAGQFAPLGLGHGPDPELRRLARF